MIRCFLFAFVAGLAWFTALTPTSADTLPVSGAYAWWDASAITGLSTGNTVTSWADSTGNGHTMTNYQGTPTYSATGLNGHPSVHFGATNVGMQTTSFGMPAGDDPYTMFVVFTQPNLPTNTSGSPFHTHAFTFGGTSGNVASIEMGNANDGRLQMAGGFGQNYYSSYVSPTGYPNKIVAVAKATGAINTSTSMAVDGTAYAAAVSPVSSTATNSFSATNSAWIAFASPVGAEGLNNADVAEVIFYNRALSSAEQNLVGYYLEQKYGLNTAYAPIPEPSSLVLIIIAGFAAVSIRRQRHV